MDDTDSPRFASKQDVSRPLSKIGVIRGLSIENINDRTCEFRNMIRGSAREKRIDFLIILWELLQAAREPRLEAHDRQWRLALQKVSNATPSGTCDSAG
jgi:hypothetical protein